MAEPSAPEPLQIKKYPNRRFYDVTRSRHVTLNDLHELVREGQVIRVTDSRTGEDITPLVLTQIILEHDPPKMSMFGSELLHQVIQSNQQMLRMFIENYFGRAFDAFVQSQTQFEDFLRRSGMPGLPAANPLAWAQSWLRGRPAADASADGSRPDDDRAALRETVDELRRQVSELRSQLDQRTGAGARRGGGSAGGSPSRSGGVRKPRPRRRT